MKMKKVSIHGVSIAYEPVSRTFMVRLTRGRKVLEEAAFLDIEPALQEALLTMYQEGWNSALKIMSGYMKETNKKIENMIFK